jgi:hypothetical protein
LKRVTFDFGKDASPAKEKFEVRNLDPSQENNEEFAQHDLD